jgi:hypothetical protein
MNCRHVERTAHWSGHGNFLLRTARCSTSAEQFVAAIKLNLRIRNGAGARTKPYAGNKPHMRGCTVRRRSVRSHRHQIVRSNAPDQRSQISDWQTRRAGPSAGPSPALAQCRGAKLAQWRLNLRCNPFVVPDNALLLCRAVHPAPHTSSAPKTLEKKIARWLALGKDHWCHPTTRAPDESNIVITCKLRANDQSRFFSRENMAWHLRCAGAAEIVETKSRRTISIREPRRRCRQACTNGLCACFLLSVV